MYDLSHTFIIQRRIYSLHKIGSTYVGKISGPDLKFFLSKNSNKYSLEKHEKLEAMNANLSPNQFMSWTPEKYSDQSSLNLRHQVFAIWGEGRLTPGIESQCDRHRPVLVHLLLFSPSMLLFILLCSPSLAFVSISSF